GDLTDAKRRVAEIEAHLEGRRLVTTGPSGEDWMAYLIVHAPRHAAMELEAKNGPLGLSAADGSITIHGVNGPVSLREGSGNVSVELENGPVSIADGSGSMRVRTENGPISISLHGKDWNGEGLDARAVNGPVALDLDNDYQGGVVVESSEHAPWSCGGPCRG